MAPKPPEVPKPGEPISKSWLRFLPSGLLRDAGEIVVSAIPGSLLLTFLIVAVGVLNIFQSSNASGPTDWYVPVFLPVVCLLPLVVGVIAPLVLERVRGIEVLPLRRSAAAAALSGLVGSAFGVLLLALFGVLGSKPFGASISSSIFLEIISILLAMLICTVLAAIGAIVLVMFLTRAEKADKPK